MASLREVVAQPAPRVGALVVPGAGFRSVRAGTPQTVAFCRQGTLGVVVKVDEDMPEMPTAGKRASDDDVKVERRPLVHVVWMGGMYSQLPWTCSPKKGYPIDVVTSQAQFAALAASHETDSKPQPVSLCIQVP